MEWLEFLDSMAIEHGLTSETLKKIFPKAHEKPVEVKVVAEKLYLKEESVKSRMRQIYKKFTEICPRLEAHQGQGKALILHQYLREKYAEERNNFPPQSESLITGFEPLIEEKTKRFCGRKFVFQAFNNFINENSQGYFTVIGEPGMGKSAIAAKYVKDNGVIHYFNELTTGCNTPDDFLNKIRQQISHYYQLQNTDRDDLKILLNKAKVKLSENRPLIIVVDALDEVATTEPGHNILDLPQNLPEQVYFLLTRRPYTAEQKKLLVAPSVKIKELDLREYKQFNRADITEYITTYIDAPEYQEKFHLWMKERQCSPPKFIQTLAEKSQNNFMYLYFVLPDIAQGKLDDLQIQQLPEGLEQYYYRQWERLLINPIKAMILSILVVADQPISCECITDIVNQKESMSKYDVQEVLDDWIQFLKKQMLVGEECYSIYHLSFSDFVEKQREIRKAIPKLGNIEQMLSDYNDSLWEELEDDSEE
ncbi:AAA family ATPase [Dapis sp. BLCC M126]|uniref:AAA family ATPase n=1 Tax=Dapis sp. BLCC M126 TaxID=3400189 RepID=UPI003CF4BBDE